jgi:hypothetical protein
MKIINLLNKDEIDSLFVYSEVTGGLLWKNTVSNRIAGTLAGSPNKKGHWVVQINEKLYRIHNLVWILFGNNIPENFIVDHIDNDPLNNRISNLRLATHSQNLLNSSKRENKSSIYKGVHWNKQSNSWRASIRINERVKYIGNFKDEYSAHLAWCDVAKEIHGEFFRDK